MRKLCSPAGFTAPLWVYKNRDSCLNICRDDKDGFKKKTSNSAIHLKLRALMSTHRAMHGIKMALRERFMRKHISHCTSVRILGLFFIWRGLNNYTYVALRTAESTVWDVGVGQTVGVCTLCDSAGPTLIPGTVSEEGLVAFIWVNTEPVNEHRQNKKFEFVSSIKQSTLSVVTSRCIQWRIELLCWWYFIVNH